MLGSDASPVALLAKDTRYVTFSGEGSESVSCEPV